jgi:alpha(1,3/1,4) fucosyltransferase
MKKIKVNFTDFWTGFAKDDNYFYHLLSQKYDVEISEDPDLLFFSVDYGRKKERDRYKNHRCKKIFYTGESVEPNFDSQEDIEIKNFAAQYSIGKCDFSFSFSRTNDPRNFRLPLWALHIDWFNVGRYGDNPSFLIPFDSISDNRFIREKKTKFCAAVFSNPTQERLRLFNRISGYKKVDGYGSIFGNHSNGELSKYEILKNYKFSICPENKISDGYFTEKLFHAKVAGTIPIYRHDKKSEIDFNEKCFINLNDFEDEKELVEFIKKLDTHKDLYYDIFNEPLFSSLDMVRNEFGPDNVLGFFEENIL